MGMISALPPAAVTRSRQVTEASHDTQSWVTRAAAFFSHSAAARRLRSWRSPSQRRRGQRRDPEPPPVAHRRRPSPLSVLVSHARADAR